MLWSMQGEKIIDYKNGFCISLADDFAILSRTKNDAEKFLEVMKEFLLERGLQISDKKTRIVRIVDGFDFLSRHYVRKNKIIYSYPSDEAVNRFMDSLKELVFENSKNLSLQAMIRNINAKLNGWASYHRVTEAKEVFEKIDIFVNSLLLKYVQMIYPKLETYQLRKRFWKIDDLGRYVFSLPNNPEKYKIINLADTVILKARKIELKNNVYLDRDYYIKLENDTEIRNVTGRFKQVWERQNGICYICNKKIREYEERTVIQKKLNRDTTIRNLIYIHQNCKETELCYIKYENISNSKLEKIIENTEKIEEGFNRKRSSKFDRLTNYFHNKKSQKFVMTFEQIEKIIGSKLCSSAYKYESYFYNHSDDRTIANSWFSQGYKIVMLDMEKHTIEFEKEKIGRPRIILPSYVFDSNIPLEVKYEVENVLEKIRNKYNLKK